LNSFFFFASMASLTKVKKSEETVFAEKDNYSRVSGSRLLM
jgi:hypothetical protein